MNHIEAASEKAAQHADTARVDVDQLVQRARALGSSGRRAMLGITGAPGAGKSTPVSYTHLTLPTIYSV